MSTENDFVAGNVRPIKRSQFTWRIRGFGAPSTTAGNFFGERLTTWASPSRI